jgi:hypothetical protein
VNGPRALPMIHAMSDEQDMLKMGGLASLILFLKCCDANRKLIFNGFPFL